VIVYADREETVDTQALLRRIRKTTNAQERFILEGQFEAGAIDALCPEFDDDISLCGIRLPDRITIRVPEGYAFYSLYPELYRDAAMRFLHEQSPAMCVVVGIRSIGAGLSVIVAEAVHATLRFTVRPRGHPFHRELRLSEALEQRLRRYAGKAWFLIVDEGPGLSGSSFMSVAVKLETLGVPRERIVLFPAHDPDPACFVSEHARANWRRYLSYVEPFVPERFVPAGARDVSGGAWRELAGIWPAVQPQHERRKYLYEGRLWKFAGLGQFGRTKLERAQRLEQFCPRAYDLSNGFLISEWVPGRHPEMSEALLDTMARYLAFLRSEFALDAPVPLKGLEEMIALNTGVELRAPQEGQLVAIDGRMLPHEWLETERGFLKTDALDHHEDHFFPGCQDIAWDIAGAAVEWSVPVEALADRYLRLQPDPGLRARLHFYTTAYKAYRLGYCQLAIDTLGDDPDGQRFRALINGYR
jgi:hypothetical protein